MSLWKLIGLDRAPGRETPGDAHTPSADAMRSVVARLERLPPERARYLALFAYVLGRVANADLEITEAETHAMEREIRALGGLEEAEAVLVVEIAKGQHRLFGSTDSYPITREFARTATREQKLQLLECLYAVSAADTTVSGTEESEIRRIVNELDLSHEEFIATRSAFREHIALLRDARRGDAPRAEP
jgi:uncharacterized tellurite resistance protein B-like protein